MPARGLRQAKAALEEATNVELLRDEAGRPGCRPDQPMGEVFPEGVQVATTAALVLARAGRQASPVCSECARACAGSQAGSFDARAPRARAPTVLIMDGPGRLRRARRDRD